MTLKNLITYLRGTEELEFPSGQVITLSGTGESSAVAFSWATTDKRALDLELRAQPISFQDADPDVAPILRYRIELGHGKMVHKFPATPVAQVVSAPMLPHRGLLMRLSAKELRIMMWVDEEEQVPNVSGATLKVSAQPALGSTQRPSIVMQDVSSIVGRLHQFPIEAREFRISNPSNGQPLPIGFAAFEVHSLTGSLVSPPVDAALYMDWTPIPALALSWTCDFLCQADYR